MQTIFLSILAFFARTIIQIHKPYVIGVTGTVGKTTISAHITSYLIHEFGHRAVAYSPYHYNGEFGLPLSIIGTKTWAKNPFRWVWVFIVAIYRIFVRYPRFLVLEYGIDRPGEMDFLLDIVVPDIAVITEIMPNHIEQFGSFSAYRWEKLKMAEATNMLIAHDTLRPYIERDTTFYGRWAMSDIDASHIEVNERWTHAIVHAYGRDYPISLPVFGEFQIDNLLPLYAIAKVLETNMEGIGVYAQTFAPESGRSGILHGIFDSIIIDGSYNWWYLSIHSGISSMRSFLHSHRIIFLLGDMRELWSEEATLHGELADEILTLFPDDSDVVFIFVGPLMLQYVVPKVAKSFPVFHFFSSRNAGNKVVDILGEWEGKPTMIYVKWSQNTIFLEEGIKQFLAHEDELKKLCRQSPEWIRKKEVFFHSLKQK